MGFQSRTLTLFLIFSLALHSLTSAQSDDEDFERKLRAPKPKFIRFGRAGAKFIRFGRSGANTWEEDQDDSLDFDKRAGAKFIRFG